MQLRLRAVRLEDVEMIMQWRTAPHVANFMYTDFEPDLERQKLWYAGICRDRTRLDWVVEVDGVDVGLLSIVRVDALNRRAEWAYYLGNSEARGKGVGRALELNVLRYVFERLGLNKLCCEVLGSNHKVVELHEKLGSKVEGRRRAHVWKRGSFHDIVEMGILREDWEREVRDVQSCDPAQFEPPIKHDP